MWNRHPIRPLVTPLLAALALSPLAVFAQGDPAAQVAPPNAPARATSPDVEIVVIVLPTGDYAVSSVYPGQVPQAAAQARINRLLSLTKWRAVHRKFSDAPAASNLLRDDAHAKLSAASFETDGGVYAADGTIDWEPFLQAFGDLRRVNIVCFTGPGFTYGGPVAWDSERIAFSATAAPGAVSATAVIKKPEANASRFGLPRFGTVVAKAPVAAVGAAKEGGRGRDAKILLLALFSVGIALAIYRLASRLVPKA